MRNVFVAFLLLLGTALGQSLSEGSVVALQISPNPLNNILTYDFELCCGYPEGSGVLALPKRCAYWHTSGRDSSIACFRFRR